MSLQQTGAVTETLSGAPEASTCKTRVPTGQDAFANLGAIQT